MFLARIDGNVVPAANHATLDGCRFLIAQRLEADGSTGISPLLIIDWLGAGNGSTVLVSSDGDIARERFGKTTLARCGERFNCARFQRARYCAGTIWQHDSGSVRGTVQLCSFPATEILRGNDLA